MSSTVPSELSFVVSLCADTIAENANVFSVDVLHVIVGLPFPVAGVAVESTSKLPPSIDVALIAILAQVPSVSTTTLYSSPVSAVSYTHLRAHET